MLSQREIQTNWPKIKTEILSHWDKLTASDVEKTYGSVNSLNKLVTEKYGQNANFSDEFNLICDKTATITTDKTITHSRPSTIGPATSGSMKANGNKSYSDESTLSRIARNQSGEISYQAVGDQPDKSPTQPAPSEPTVPDEVEVTQDPTPTTEVPQGMKMANPKQPSLPEQNRTREGSASIDTNSTPRAPEEKIEDLGTNSKPNNSQKRTQK